MTPPVLWVGAVVVEEDRILLVRRASPSGLWSLPSVAVAADEPLAAAVVRAVREDAGLEAVCDRLLGHLEYLGGDGHRVLLAFAATALPGLEVQPASWVDLDEVTDRALVEGLAEFLAEQGVLRLIA